MRHQTVVPSNSVRLRESRSFNTFFHSTLGVSAVRGAVMLLAIFAGLEGAAFAADTNSAGAAASAPIKVPMTAEHWQVESAAFEKIQGMDAIALHQGGYAI